MSIEWFPGHMEAAAKAAEESLSRIDVIVEVLDARVPASSKSPLIEAMRRRGQKPGLKVLNKSDLADFTRTKAWLTFYNAQEGTRAIALSAKVARDVKRIEKECLRLLPERGTVKKPLRMLIMGIPNVGKSTLINTLLGRSVAKVGDEPGITRTQTRHVLSPTATLLDTAGMLWPRVREQVAMRLAATNNIGVNAYDEETVAFALASQLLRDYRNGLAERFGALPEGVDGPGVLTHVARARSFVAKGGALDLRKAALALLYDFRQGALGPVTLDDPSEAAS